MTTQNLRFYIVSNTEVIRDKVIEALQSTDFKTTEQIQADRLALSLIEDDSPASATLDPSPSYSEYRYLTVLDQVLTNAAVETGDFVGTINPRPETSALLFPASENVATQVSVPQFLSVNHGYQTEAPADSAVFVIAVSALTLPSA